MRSMSMMLAVVALAMGTSAYYKPDDSLPWMRASDSPKTRASILLNSMNLTEKLHLFHGSNLNQEGGRYVGGVAFQPRLNIPAIRLNDGPQGFRNADPAFRFTSTAWPSGLTIGSTFDVEAAQLWGASMGEEFLGKGANVQLGPGVCLARVPKCGRLFEYISGGDPFLGHTMIQPAVKGIQSMGVVANAKHYIMNNQETNRTTTSAEVDERTVFEMYLPPFAGAVEAGVGSMMCSYNRINMTWSCENPATLGQDLKLRTGFDGWVMSDWGATHSPSLNAGLDQEMPGDRYMGGDSDGECTELCALIRSGKVSMASVNASVVRILTPLFRMGVFDRPQSNTSRMNVTSPEHNAVARKLAADSTILLKNDGGVLPLSDGDQALTVAVIGQQAATPIVHGGGSGQVFPYYVSDPLSAILRRLGIPQPPPVSSNCSEANWDVGTDFRNTDSQTEASAASVAECCQQCADRATPCKAFSFVNGQCWMKADTANPVHDAQVTSGVVRASARPTRMCSGNKCVVFSDGSNATAAAALAAGADVALVFVATTSSEGSDRETLDLDGNANDLIPAVGRAQPRTAVCMVHPGPVNTPWRGSVPAIVASFMPGQEYGNALTDVLFGDASPFARLPLTLPGENQTVLTPEQWPGFDNVARYTERLEVDYRYYDAHGLTPAFPFGHGLSYTAFDYSDLAVARDKVTFTVRNAGTRAGAEIAQLYLTFPAAAGEPPMQLKGFQKVPLGAGQSASVTLPLDDRALSVWDVASHDWAVVPGTFQAHVGASSRDIRLSGPLRVAH